MKVIVEPMRDLDPKKVLADFCAPNDGACEWLCITNCPRLTYRCALPMRPGESPK